MVRMPKPVSDIFLYLETNYPYESHSLLVGAPNCIIREYAPQTRTLKAALNFTEREKIYEIEGFFEVFDSKSDEELLKIRNFGKKKLKFLRKASEEYHGSKNEKDIPKTQFNFIGADWKRVKNHCRTTVNKQFTDNEPGKEFKQKLLLSEHTPIRLIEVDWSWKDIPSWVSVHWTRHKHEKFVSTQRDDRKEHNVSRSEMPQGTLVNMDNYANAQQLIDIFRKRLCYQASSETRALAEDFKRALYEKEPELADALVPNCIYRCGCPEFQTCGYFKNFLNYVSFGYQFIEDPSIDLTDISKRYELYNEYFKGDKKGDGDSEDT